MPIDRKKVKEIYQEMIPIRRQFHANPELSGAEFETTKKIRSLLKEWSIEMEEIGMKNGTVGFIEGLKPGKTLAIRADIDALPLVEKTNLSFASENGAMHACGHDIHTVILLGTAKYLKSIEKLLSGRVKFFFQPNEEKDGGARDMIEAGAMEGVDYVIGLHLDPAQKSGVLGFKKGFFNASVNNFTIRIKGLGGHGAHPETGLDPILASAHIITGLQSLISRRISPLDPAILNIGSIHGGSQPNIIPYEVEMSGTLRTSNEETREFLKNEIIHLVSYIGESMHMKTEVNIQDGYISLINDPIITQRLIEASASFFGYDNTISIHAPSMGADDFSYFLKEAPGTYYTLGCRREGTPFHPIHSEYFNPDERSIYYGILSQLAATFELLDIIY